CHGCCAVKSSMPTWSPSFSSSNPRAMLPMWPRRPAKPGSDQAFRRQARDRLVVSKKHLTAEPTPKAGAFKTVHERPFDLGQMQGNPGLGQTGLNGLQAFQGTGIDIV